MRSLTSYRPQLTIIAVSITVILVSACFGPPSAPPPWVHPPPPKVRSVEPPSAKAGGPDLKLTIHGSMFYTPIWVQWNGRNVYSRYRNPRTLEAVVPAREIATPGEYQ